MTPIDEVYPEIDMRIQDMRVCRICNNPKPIMAFAKIYKSQNRRLACRSCSANLIKLDVQKQILSSSATTKFCTMCDKEKVLDDFFKDALAPLGRKRQCKECCDNDRVKRTEKRRITRLNHTLPDTKICTISGCIHNGESQCVSNFWVNSASVDGLMYQCKDCVKKTNAKWSLANKDKKRETRRRESSRRYLATRESNWHVNSMRRLKVRAKKDGIPFNIVASDLLNPNTGKRFEYCPVFPHIRLDYSAGPDRRLWASVDRIVPELGYTRDNVCVVSMAANTWKTNGSNPAERSRIVQIMRGSAKMKINKSQLGLVFD